MQDQLILVCVFVSFVQKCKYIEFAFGSLHIYIATLKSHIHKHISQDSLHSAIVSFYELFNSEVLSSCVNGMYWTIEFRKCILIFRLVQYSRRKTGLKDLHVSLVEELTHVEKELVASQDVIEIRGKVSTVQFLVHQKCRKWVVTQQSITTENVYGLVPNRYGLVILNILWQKNSHYGLVLILTSFLHCTM